MNLSDVQRNLDSYLAAVRIETDGDPEPFAKVADPWQMQAIRAIAPVLFGNSRIRSRPRSNASVRNSAGL